MASDESGSHLAVGILEKPILEYGRVQLWLEDFRKSWGDEREVIEPKLQALAEFCEFVGKDPDSIIAECLVQLEDGYEKIRYKARHRYIQLIAEFEGTCPGGRTAANAVRSFLIHNGVAMGTHILR